MKGKGGSSMPQQVKRISSVEHRQTLTLNEIFWRDISEPGAYVEVGSGDLYRFPKEALTQGLSPLVRKESAETPRLIRTIGFVRSSHRDFQTDQLDRRLKTINMSSHGNGNLFELCYIIDEVLRQHEELTHDPPFSCSPGR
jgi:hypothetical protein